MRRSISALCLAFGVTHSASGQQLTACEVPGLTGDVRCGTVEVYENRAAQSGRRIALSVIVARATGPDRAPDPFFLFAGGPGQAPSGMIPFANDAFSLVRQRRDLVFADFRGTGRSAPLMCRLHRTPQDFFGDFYPAAGVQFCRDSLGAHADLRQYTTNNIADDIDDVRAALGYDRIDIYGTSYGTRVAFVYMRRHPERVRAVVMKAIAPPDAHMPMGYARDAQRALELLVRDCSRDADCARLYPNFATEFDAVIAKARAGKLRAAWPNQFASARATLGDSVTIPADALTSTIMGFMQSVDTRAQLPLAIHRAAQGDASMLAQSIAQYRSLLSTGISMGMHLSVMCSEDTRWLDPAVAARDNATTFLGDARVRSQLGACRAWPRGDVRDDYDDPVRSAAPVLLVSGELDPNTPQRWGEQALKTLPNGRHVVLPLVGHNFSSVQTCGAQFVAAFIERANAREIDTSCAAGIRLPPFAR
ncbi:MAG: alpha/beta fold hydrolase [Gemmatimonadota bacterium]